MRIILDFLRNLITFKINFVYINGNFKGKTIIVKGTFWQTWQLISIWQTLARRGGRCERRPRSPISVESDENKRRRPIKKLNASFSCTPSPTRDPRGPRGPRRVPWAPPGPAQVRRGPKVACWDLKLALETAGSLRETFWTTRYLLFAQLPLLNLSNVIVKLFPKLP